MFELVDDAAESAVIKVIGVGGGGGNAVEHMVSQNIEGVDFICANTDAQALQNLSAKTLLQLGNAITKGLGAGADPTGVKMLRLRIESVLLRCCRERIWYLLLQAWAEVQVPVRHQ